MDNAYEFIGLNQQIPVRTTVFGQDMVSHRNATREKMFGFVTIPGNPATGYERDVYAFDYALWFTAGGDWPQEDLPLWIERMADSP